MARFETDKGFCCSNRQGVAMPCESLTNVDFNLKKSPTHSHVRGYYSLIDLEID